MMIKMKDKTICAAFAFMLFLMVSLLAQPVSAADGSVLIERFSVAEGSLLAGEAVTLQFTVKNYSAVDAADLVVAFETNAGAIYVPFGQSNRCFIGAVGAGRSVTFQTEFVLARHVSGPLELAAVLEYKSAEADATYAARTVLYLPVLNETSFSATFNVGETVYERLPAYIDGVFSNLSTQTMHNLAIKVTGDLLDAPAEASFGDVQPGRQLQISQPLAYSAAAGKGQVTVALTFTDADGNVYAPTPQVFDVTISQLPALEDGAAQRGAGVNGGIPVWAAVMLVGVLCVAATGGVYWLVLRKNGAVGRK